MVSAQYPVEINGNPDCYRQLVDTLRQLKGYEGFKADLGARALAEKRDVDFVDPEVVILRVIYDGSTFILFPVERLKQGIEKAVERLKQNVNGLEVKV